MYRHNNQSDWLHQDLGSDTTHCTWGLRDCGVAGHSFTWAFQCSFINVWFCSCLDSVSPEFSLFWAIRVQISLSLYILAFTWAFKCSCSCHRYMSFLHSVSVGHSNSRFCAMITRLRSRLDSVSLGFSNALFLAIYARFCSLLNNFSLRLPSTLLWAMFAQFCS